MGAVTKFQTREWAGLKPRKCAKPQIHNYFHFKVQKRLRVWFLSSEESRYFWLFLPFWWIFGQTNILIFITFQPRRTRFEFWTAGNDIDKENEWIWSGPTREPVAGKASFQLKFWAKMIQFVHFKKTILSSFKIIIIFNNTSANFILFQLMYYWKWS